MQEAVDHHPIIAKHRPDQLRPGRRDARGVRLQANTTDQGLSEVERIIGASPGRVRSFQFHENAVLVLMHRGIDPEIDRRQGNIEQDATDLGAAAPRRRVAEVVCDLLTENLDEAPSHKFATQGEPIQGIGRMMRDAKILRLAHKHHAMRLNAAGNVDGFSVAIRQIDDKGRIFGIGFNHFAHYRLNDILAEKVATRNDIRMIPFPWR